MRRVLRSNADVAHVWAQQVQDEERSGNMFFEGDTIYSYGHHFPIARFVKKDVVPGHPPFFRMPVKAKLAGSTHVFEFSGVYTVV